MIFFQTATTLTDLTHLKPSLIEENNWFVNDSVKNYSLPFLIDLESDIARKLGLPNTDNIDTYKIIIKGTLILDDDFFDAYIKLGEVRGKYIEATLFYGEDVLEVYDKNIQDLPWPTIVMPTTLEAYATSILDKTYPEVSHNFPMLYRPSIQTKEDYADFLFFVNNYSPGGGFVSNLKLTGPPIQFLNKNVMAPFPYVLEIFRFAYAQEGKQVAGNFFDSDLFKSLIYIPTTYFERFLESEYDAHQFTFPNGTPIIIDSVEMGVFERAYLPTSLGTYELSLDFNFTPSQAAYFSLKVTIKNATTQVITTLFSASSTDHYVNIAENLEINVESDNLFDQIKIELIIPAQPYSIEPYNAIEFSFKEGRLNTFPSQFSLAEFVPNMIFGDFENLFKNWLNLDIVKVDNIVNINFVEDKIKNLNIVSKEHLEDPKPKKRLNSDRFYILTYKNNERVTVDSSGQVFTTASEHQEEINLESNVYPTVVKENFGNLTGTFKEKTDALQFGFYSGLQNGINTMVEGVNGQSLSLQEVHDRHWKVWLRFRTNSKTIKDSFKAHSSELFNLKDGIKKYNELQIIKSIKKKRESNAYWKIESESEAF